MATSQGDRRVGKKHSDKSNGQPGVPAKKTRTRWPKPEMFDWTKYDPEKTPNTGSVSLMDEMITYRDNLPRLIKESAGKFVLIKGKEVVGVYESRDEALDEAVERFKAAPVFVKRIAAKEPVVYIGGGSF